LETPTWQHLKIKWTCTCGTKNEANISDGNADLLGCSECNKEFDIDLEIYQV
jgi:hypothetical protein